MKRREWGIIAIKIQDIIKRAHVKLNLMCFMWLLTWHFKESSQGKWKIFWSKFLYQESKMHTRHMRTIVIYCTKWKMSLHAKMEVPFLIQTANKFLLQILLFSRYFLFLKHKYIFVILQKSKGLFGFSSRWLFNP